MHVKFASILYYVHRERDRKRDIMTSRNTTPKVDIQALVEDWALDYFRRKATRKERRLLDQELIRQEVDWRRVQFAHDDAVYEPEPPSPGASAAEPPMPNVLFQTTFANRTNREQTYSFRAERTTRSRRVSITLRNLQLNYSHLDLSNLQSQLHRAEADIMAVQTAGTCIILFISSTSK